MTVYIIIQFYKPFLRVAIGTNVNLCLLVHVYDTLYRRPLVNNRAIVNYFQALLNPSSQIDFPVALVISHYLYTLYLEDGPDPLLFYLQASYISLYTK